jgi:mannosyltransferase
MRLDTDPLLTAPLCYGPFEVVHTRHRSYGYLATASDPPELSVGLWDFVRNYAQSHPSVKHQSRANHWRWSHKDENGDETLRFEGYYNHFEIVKFAAFRRPDVKQWLNALVNYPEGIFKWRWGEPGPMQSL